MATETAEVDSKGIDQLVTQSALDDVDMRLREGIEQRGMGLMAVVDHHANAEKVGLELPPTRTFIFGNPEVGTALMQCEGSVALDLPQKMVVRQSEEGVVIEWNDPHYLVERHELEACELPIDKMSEALTGLAREAAGGE
ncbi:DUF302 domain-containing protein [Halomonas binhaiensis]|uniref:DUF302 domain-containing protein n=2 Tax=Halomonas binhaiensis TaxID=2562282 RepID=A0A856QVU1_9GAMM|nr:DUF302 domain-containing protein [Halomonas binhaiensis]